MDLVEVRFPTAGKVVWVQPGTTLLDAAGQAGVDLATGCRRGMCGTDAVRVGVDRPGAIDAPGEAEAGTLARMGVAGGCRLACSAHVRAGIVEVLGDALA